MEFPEGQSEWAHQGEAPEIPGQFADLSEIVSPQQGEEIGPEPEADVGPVGNAGDEKPQRDPAAAAETRRIISKIEERRELRARADELRVEALQLALNYGLLDEFPQLRLWERDALEKGLAVRPSKPVETGDNFRDAVLGRIQGKIDEVAAIELKCDALTAEIVPKN